MSRKNINKGKNLADQIRALLGSAICLLLFFAGMGLSYLILSVNDNYTKAIQYGSESFFIYRTSKNILTSRVYNYKLNASL